MTFCTIDAGNTWIKIAFFEQDECVATHHQLTEEQTLEILAQQKPLYVLVASVRTFSVIFEEYLQTVFGKNLFFLSPDLPLPIGNLYDTPKTLGMDRLATAVGAWDLFPQKNCLIIDAGTCITYDFLDEKGDFQGGNITLGLEMRLKALHEFTAKLPKVTKNEKPLTLIGKNTTQAIHNGVVQGIIFEIKGYQEAYITQNPATKDTFCVILCGGDTDFLMETLLNKINFQIFARPNLALWGLHRILKYNVAKNS